MMDRYNKCLLGESTLDGLSKGAGMVGAFQVGIPLFRFKGGRAAGGLRRLDAGSVGLGRSVTAAQFG